MNQERHFASCLSSRRSAVIRSSATIAVLVALMPSALIAQSNIVPNWKINPEKQLTPNTRWVREAKWGLFSHYLANHSEGLPEGMNEKRWNKKVDSFQIETFADQLSEPKVPYFFITLGRGAYYCSPNSTYECNGSP